MKTKIGILSILIVAGIYSCSKDSLEQQKESFSIKQDGVDSANKSAQYSYTSEEYFKALLYTVGEFTNEVSNLDYARNRLQSFPVEIRKKREKIVDSIVSEIKLKDPDFFRKFGEGITSGRHSDIYEALKNCTDHTLYYNLDNAALNMEEYSFEELDELIRGNQTEMSSTELDVIEALETPTVIVVPIVGAVSLQVSGDSKDIVAATTSVDKLDIDLRNLANTLAEMNLSISK